MKKNESTMSRRRLLTKTSVGAGLMPGVPSVLRAAEEQSGVLNVVLAGFGKQGQVPFDSMKHIPGLHFQAVCDLSPWSLRRGVGLTRDMLLNGDRICGQIVNANAQWNRSTPLSPPSSLRQGFYRQAGPAQRLLQGPPVRSKLQQPAIVFPSN
jgi:hypothetical protein